MGAPEAWASRLKAKRRPITFVLDENLASTKEAEIYKVLSALNATAVELLVEHFPRGAKDVEWLPKIVPRGWILLTKDTMLRRRKLEVQAWTRAGAAVCVLSGGEITGRQAALAFATAMPKIRLWLGKYTRPLVIAVSHSGNADVKVGERRGGVKKDKLGISEWSTEEHRARHNGETEAARDARRPRSERSGRTRQSSGARRRESDG